jgi:hypothetical protein
MQRQSWTLRSCVSVGKALCSARPIHGSIMVTMKFVSLARIAPALALLSCAAPKATVVAPAPAPKKSQAPAEPGFSEPALPDDGIRLPDMLAMPGDGEFRATRPNPSKVGPEGAVIARPPTDPPSRPKPKDTERD